MTYPKHQTLRKKMVSSGYKLICSSRSRNTGSYSHPSVSNQFQRAHPTLSGISPVPNLPTINHLPRASAPTLTHTAPVSTYIRSKTLRPLFNLPYPSPFTPGSDQGIINSCIAGFRLNPCKNNLSALTSPVCSIALFADLIRNLRAIRPSSAVAIEREESTRTLRIQDSGSRRGA